MGWLWSIIAWIVGKLFGKPAGPSQEAQEAAKAGALGVALQTEENANAEITKAAQAGVAANAVVADPSKLRKFEQSDPNNRDNDGS